MLRTDHNKIKLTVLILSTDQDDSTSKVIDWINSMGHHFIRINYPSVIYLQSIEIGQNDSIKIRTDNNNIDINSIHSFWYRRGEFRFNYNELFLPNQFKPIELTQHLYLEDKSMADFVSLHLSKGKHLGKFDKFSLNKLDVLMLAKSIGLKIPSTLVTNNKNDLNTFKNKYDSIICKPISEVITISCNDGMIKTYIELISESMINSMPDKFYPTLIQEKIEKNTKYALFI